MSFVSWDTTAKSIRNLRRFAVLHFSIVFHIYSISWLGDGSTSNRTTREDHVNSRIYVTAQDLEKYSTTTEHNTSRDIASGRNSSDTQMRHDRTIFHNWRIDSGYFWTRSISSHPFNAPRVAILSRWIEKFSKFIDLPAGKKKHCWEMSYLFLKKFAKTVWRWRPTVLPTLI